MTVLTEERRMETRHICEGNMFMSMLRVTHARYEKEHHCDAGGGADSHRIVLVVKGKVDIRSQGIHLNFSAEDGGMFYIPQSAQYHIIWSGTPEIEYYIFSMAGSKFGSDNSEFYNIQPIIGVDREYALSTAAEITKLLSDTDRAAKIRAIGLYCTMYSDILPRLSAVQKKHLHTAVTKAAAYIEAHYSEDFDIASLASDVCVSESRLFHLFRKELDTTPIRYRCSVRVRCAAKQLRETDMPLDEIAEANGFNSIGYFREMFKREIGVTPAQYREMAKENSK